GWESTLRRQMVGQRGERRELEVWAAAVGRSLALAVDPRDGNAERPRGPHVVEVALCGVQPRPVADDGAGGGEVPGRRLVGTHLLRGDHHVEAGEEMAASPIEQLVVHVRQDAEP